MNICCFLKTHIWLWICLPFRPLSNPFHLSVHTRTDFTIIMKRILQIASIIAQQKKNEEEGEEGIEGKKMFNDN